jgi:hypothetical protein
LAAIAIYAIPTIAIACFGRTLEQLDTTSRHQLLHGLRLLAAESARSETTKP